MQSLSRLPIKAFAESTQKNSFVLNQFSQNYDSGSYVHLIKLSDGFWIECEFSDGFEIANSIDLVAEELSGMLSASGQMLSTHSEMRDLPYANIKMADVGDAPWHLIVVEGVFPGRPISTSIDVINGGVTIRVVGRIQ